MAIKLLLSDVDGTLVTQSKALTPAAVAAARALRDAGIRLALTSGRPPRGMRMLVEPLELSGMLAGFNGGVFVDPDMTVRKQHMLAPRVARAALDSVLASGIDAWVYTADEWLVLDRDGAHVAREAETVQFPPTVVPAFTDAHLAACAKIVGVSDDHQRVAAAEEAAQTALGADASATRSQPYYLDITHKQANKGAVVDALADMFGLSRDEIATIGDGGNDTLMFARSGLSIAMGNATDAVKARATVVTDSNESDGFAKAVRAHILGEAS
ncbi:Cof-type HAD-IIB family hydrolase [Acidisphaera rubrifaciens]|uniref:Hydrolase n=1 Tax=Acidisphaera rubrifaciens HS-AP3 TaxID=1231350 RepID=A0A0D6P698_9PROT|nr:Cof-type HAD-IIB family hydrolase [Acidisphaera rubrifaciens]GAN76404.1 hydrolase [Acidisphaera rubrifaciens HS-AP3]